MNPIKSIVILSVVFLMSCTSSVNEKTMNYKDRSDFQPFKLIDNRKSKWADVRVSFDSWGWLKKTHGDNVDGYYLNGYGVQGLVLAARVLKRLPAYTSTMDLNSEGDTCYMIFQNYDEAIETIQIASEMINDKSLLVESIKIAKEYRLNEI